MSVKVLFFDYRKTEEKFFNEHKFNNLDISFLDYPLNEETVKNISEEDKENTVIISIFVNSNLTDEVINQFKNLRIIAIRATGYDNVNLRSCQNRNIAVLNVQNYGATSVAEFTFGLILSLVRKLPQSIQSVKNGTFNSATLVGRDLKNLTLGVIGTGAIGSSVCRLAYAFGMKILAYDLIQKIELIQKYNIVYNTLDEVIKNSDVITLHLPYTGDNYHMFSKREFDLMKMNSYIVNVSRGELIDNVFLKENIENGKLSAVALDVVACSGMCQACVEYSKKLDVSSLKCLEDSQIIKDLINKDNVIITPHIAYESQDAIDYILKTTFDSIRENMNGDNNNRIV